MATWSKKEQSWRDEFRAAMAAAGLIDEFKSKVGVLIIELMKIHKDRKYCDKVAQLEVSKQYHHIFDPVAFNARWAAKVDSDRSERAARGLPVPVLPRQKGRRAQEKKRKDKVDNDLLSAKLSLDASKFSASDMLEDAKWVYANMARLVGPDGKSNKNVLQQAPSSGAVGLAAFALEDPKAFFEKFVVRILPKDEEKSAGPTEEELLKELDPTFDELVKYMKRLDDLPTHTVVTKTGEDQED